MSQEITRIKRRIKAIKGTYKITSAMKVVSSVKLKRWKNKMLATREYAHQIDEITSLVFSNLADKSKKDNDFFLKNDSRSNLYIIMSSSLGLCGAYNSNIFRLADVCLNAEDDVIILGNKGIKYYQNGQFNKIETFKEYSSVNDKNIIDDITAYIYSSYKDEKYREIHLIYTAYKNSLVFYSVDYMIFPLKKDEAKKQVYPPIMEPDPKTLVERLIPMYLKNTIYAKFLESEVCEQAARLNAMENATKNAEELLDDLHIKFNKARQNAITQEITEIVGAVNN
ncbi:MAG TPA: ATP synthase F1 subunit gamma [Erysipelotrichaceae bacterium]|nr:ATP synthase F1 subunit gamma [Erysipelotrichaceae bacterium]